MENRQDCVYNLGNLIVIPIVLIEGHFNNFGDIFALGPHSLSGCRRKCDSRMLECCK